MGVTIHYKGTLNSPDLIDPFCEEIQDISREMDWDYKFLDEDLGQPNTSYVSGKGVIKGHVPLKGIIVVIHPEAEPLSLLFDKNGEVRSLSMMAIMDEEALKNSYVFVKTQFAPLETHISLVKLLQYLKKKYMNNLEVIDEGKYWETEDRALLKEKMDFLDQKIEEVGDMFANMKKDDHETAESMIKKMEEVLKNRYNEKK